MEQFSDLHLADDACIVSSQIPGPGSRELLEFQSRYEGAIVSYPRSLPFAQHRALGAVIEDIDGNRYLDFFSGCGVLNVGHCNPHVLEYVREQQERLIHALDFPTETKRTTIRHIINHLPEDMREEYKVAFCGPTGSDSVEAAIKLARQHTGRTGVIAFKGSYHGMTSTANAVTSNNRYRTKIPSQIPNVHFLPYAYPYRWPYAVRDEADLIEQALRYLRETLENPHSGVAKPACVLLETLQGEGGNIVPPIGYIKGLIDIAHEHGVLVIADEVQSGFFRTGEFLDLMNTQARPDIICVSKGLGGVGFPIAGLIYRRSVEAWGPGDHIGTFRANQVSLAAANGAFDFVDNHNLGAWVKEIGQYTREGLRAVQERSRFIGEVRGRGLMIGVEFVRDRDSRVPLPEIMPALRASCLAKGLLFEVGGYYHNVLRILPPLIVTRTIVDRFLGRFSDALAAVEAQY